MSLKPSIATANGAANGTGLKEQFDGGFLFLFAGAVPATADAALDMVSVHTQVAKISVGNDGVTGLTFDAPSGGALSKAAAEAWSGSATFDGFSSASGSLAPTFYRFCEPGDTGRGAATTQYRIQGTVGGPSSGADLVISGTTITAAAVQPIGAFVWRVGQAP